MLSILSGLRNRLGLGPRPPAAAPWFDQPNALELLDRRHRSGELKADEFNLLTKWVTDGYVVVDNVVSDDEIDGMLQFLESSYHATRPIKRLTYLGIKETADATPAALSHADLISKYNPAQRQTILTQSNWRIHSLHEIEAHARRIYFNRRVADLCSLIMGCRAIPRASINFMHGSAQRLHQDMGVFHIMPRNYLIGAWLACEDISPDSGPLIYYPGSHRGEWYPRFSNYPQTNLRTAPKADIEGYHEFIDEQAQRFPQHLFHGRKGQVLLWHGMLIHGGSEIKKAGSTRKSFVVHYVAPGADRAHEVVGPFNW